MRSSCSMTSCGVPSVAIVVNRLSEVSAFLKYRGRTGPLVGSKLMRFTSRATAA
jgi:hypothetical protein